MTRREAREQAFILLFEKSFHKETMRELIDLARESRVIAKENTNKKCETWEMHLDPFAEQTALRAQEHLDELDEYIERLSLKWKKNRISRAAFAVLRLALYEMLYEPEIPVGVSINEAVDIAKKYAGEEDSAFVNGLLGTAAKEIAAGEPPVPDKLDEQPEAIASSDDRADFDEPVGTIEKLPDIPDFKNDVGVNDNE